MASPPFNISQPLGALLRLRRPSEVTLTLSADTNDAVVTGIGAATKIVVYDAAGGHKLTGVIAGSLGDEITIQYRYDAVGVTVLTARDPASSSGNRFVMARNVTLKPYQSISFRYGQDSAGLGWYPTDDRFGTAADSAATDFDAAGAAATVLVTAEAYADAIVAKLIAKYATAGALPTHSYSNGSSGVGATITITATGVYAPDGTNVVLNDYVLVWKETVHNGLYKCTTAGAVGVSAVFTRADRMDTTGEFIAAQILVLAGNTLAGRIFTCTNAAAPVVGTDAITFRPDSILIQDEGSLLGAAHTVNVTGTGATASLTNGVATIDVPVPSFETAFDPRTQFFDYSEMTGSPASGSEGWATTAGAATLNTPSADVKGAWRFTNATGLSAASGALSYIIGGGKALRCYFKFRIGAVSTPTSRFSFDIGWRDNVTGSLVDGLVAEYTDNVNSGALKLINTTSSVATASANGTTVLAAATWYSGYIEIATGGGSATLVLNGNVECVLTATLTAAPLRKALLLFGTSGVGHQFDHDFVHIVGDR